WWRCISPRRCWSTAFTTLRQASPFCVAAGRQTISSWAARQTSRCTDPSDGLPQAGLVAPAIVIRYATTYREEVQHGAIHWRLPVRRRAASGFGSAVSGWSLPLPRLPQASWCAVLCGGDVPVRGGDHRGRNARLRRAPLLSALRIVGVRP